MTRRPIGMKTFLLAAAAVLAVTLSACGGDEDPGLTAEDEQSAAAPSLDDLDGRAFGSVRVEGRRLVDETRILLGFQGTDISVEAGCNHLFGNAALDGDTLTVSNMGGTEMGCPRPLQDQDVWLTEFLTGGTTMTLDGDTLTLSAGDVVVELVEEEAADGPEEEPDEPTADSSEGQMVQ